MLSESKLKSLKVGDPLYVHSSSGGSREVTVIAIKEKYFYTDITESKGAWHRSDSRPKANNSSVWREIYDSKEVHEALMLRDKSIRQLLSFFSTDYYLRNMTDEELKATYLVAKEVQKRLKQ